MNKKGFTLIELLAVIVILAIIALIATPIILGIINDAKNQSAERSAELYLKGAELAIARKNLTAEFGDATCSVLPATGNLSCEGVTGEIPVEMDGEKPTSGTIVFSNGKITSVTNLQTSGKTFETDSNGKLVIVGSSSSNTNNDQEQGNTSGEQTNTQTMYYTYDLSGTVGSTAAPANPSTAAPTGKNVYLGYSISEGKVSAAYVCFIRNSKEYCLKGADPDAYSDNQDVIRDAFKDVADMSACPFSDDGFHCEFGGLYAGITYSGIVEVSYGSSVCYTSDDGNFACE